MPDPDHSVMPGPDRASLSLLYVKKTGPAVRSNCTYRLGVGC